MENQRSGVLLPMKTERKRMSLLPAFSGVVLVLLFAYYLPKLLAARPPARSRQVDVILFTGRIEAFYRQNYQVPFQELRNYTEVHLKGEPASDNIKLDFARIRIREITQEQDTVNGIRFTFGDRATYSTFIRSLDVLNQERAEQWILDNGEIWFLRALP